MVDYFFGKKVQQRNRIRYLVVLLFYFKEKRILKRSLLQLICSIEYGIISI